jgi:hypothetical protein
MALTIIVMFADKFPVLLGFGLLLAPWIESFRVNGEKWKPQSSRLGWWLLAPLVIIYILSNAFVLILSWFPENLQSVTRTTQQTLPYYTGPVTALGIIGFGIMWWAWDSHILPFLGYHFQVEESEEFSMRWQMNTLCVSFHVRPISLKLFPSTVGILELTCVPLAHVGWR